MSTTIEDIGKIITWYQEQYAGAPIEQYMDAKSKLLILCYEFSSTVADLKKQSDEAANIRKADFNAFKIQFLDEGYTLGKAEARAEVAIRAQRAYEAESAALFFKSKSLLDIALKAYEDMTQRVSVLRKEKDNA